jgi:signal transduction histidine kinase
MLGTVRVRATINAVAVMALAVGLASIALVALLHRSLQREIDDRATLRLHDVAALAERGQLPPTLAGVDEDGTVAQVVVSGRVVAQSAVVQGAVPLASFAPATSQVVVRTVGRAHIVGGAVYRVAAAAVSTPGGPAVVYVAASLEPVTDGIHALEALLAVVGPALVLIVGVMTWMLVGRTLDPVEDIRRQVAEISAADLARRVPEPGTGDEVHKLAQTMNEMLARLEDAADGQRRFVSDAAHELRSPLATIRTDLEVASTHPETTDVAALVQRLGRATARMSRLVEELLVLAPAEERGSSPRVDVDLDELVLRHLESLRATSALTVKAPRLDGARLTGDRDQLDRVVTNVLDNATRHATSSITITLSAESGVAELVIADDGPGVPRAERQRVFERFARVEGSRARLGGGAGLGLSIARRIVEDHGGTIELADAAPGTRAVIRLPLPSPSIPTEGDHHRELAQGEPVSGS